MNRNVVNSNATGCNNKGSCITTREKDSSDVFGRIDGFLLWGLMALAGVFLAVGGCDSGGVEEPGPGEGEDPPGSTNEAPSAVAAAEPTDAEVGTQVTLDGSDSSDPDGDELSFNWSISVPQGSEATLSDPNTVDPTFTPDVSGDYTATLEVSDGDATDEDEAGLTATRPAKIIDGPILEDSTLKSDERYRFLVATENSVGNEVVVGDGATLTIEPGAELLFEEGAGLLAATGGSIIAEGTAEDSISMTGTSKQAGWWKGITLKSGDNVFDYVDIRHTGSIAPNVTGVESAIQLGGPSGISLKNSTIRNGSGGGLVTEDEFGTPDNFEVSSNTFSELEGPAVRIQFKLIGAFSGSNSFSEGSVVEVFGPGGNANLSNDATISALNGDTPYRITGYPEVNSMAGGEITLTIEPGTQMEFEEDAYLNLQGGLGEDTLTVIAEGEPGNRIRMTATSGNEEPGWWEGLRMSEQFDVTLRNVVIRHGGSQESHGSDAAVLYLPDTDLPGVPPGSLTVRNSSIEESGNHGIFCGSSGIELDASGNSYSGIEGELITGCQ